MALLIDSERWCEQAVGRSVTSLRTIRCGDVATHLCASCGRGLCESHEQFCKLCQRAFCSRCDHECKEDARVDAVA